MFTFPMTMFSSSGLPPTPDGRSLSFTAASSQKLTMTSANFGSYNRAKFAVSLWFKRGSISTQHALIGKSNAGGDQTEFYIVIQASNKIDFTTHSSSGVMNGRLLTTSTYTDTTDFHHLLVHFDSANATPGDRMRMWVDGIEVTVFDIDTNPTAPAFISSATMDIGALTTIFYNGLIYQPALFSGTLPNITDVYNGGPVDLTGLPGLYSYLRTTGTSTLEDDAILTTNWTNTNTVTKSTTVPV